MANKLIIIALKTKSKSFTLSSRKINSVSTEVARLTWIFSLHLNNNCLADLPIELRSLQQLTELNLGNNILQEIPPVLKHFRCLKKLYLFGNKIGNLSSEVLDGLPDLVLLNLNRNKLRTIPPAIKSLINLETISVADNLLEEIAPELGSLTRLTEINLSNNKLTKIPQQLYSLTNLKRLHISRNNLTELPEGVLGWINLRVLDVAGNRLSMFPIDFHCLPLEQLFVEGNNLIPHEVLASFQEDEVMPLKELAVRVVLREEPRRWSVVSRALPLHPGLASVLATACKCALCAEPFLNTWLECVQFIHLAKDMKMRSTKTIPVRVLLCSYACLHKTGHAYYRVASAVGIKSA